jgi:hypothetical protein
MPPRPPLAGTVIITLNWLGPNSVKAANVFHAMMGGTFNPTVANLSTIATNMQTALRAGTTPNIIMVNISSAWELLSIAVVDNGGSTENAVVLPDGGKGSDAPTPLPPNCAACISWQIGAHYRGGHPRTYLPGIASANLAAVGGNWWLTAFRTTLTNAAQSMLNSFNAATAGGSSETLGTISYFRAGELLAKPNWYPYLLPNVHQRVDSQRRRLGKENVLA